MSARPRVVVTVGDDALLGSGAPERVADGYEALVEVSRSVARLAEEGYDVVVAHGCGPQLEVALLRDHHSYEAFPEPPLDVTLAEVGGGLGYLLQQALASEFRLRGIDRRLVTVITRVEVDIGDAAFLQPAKAIGPAYTDLVAQSRADSEGWHVAEDPGRGWRRMVATPKPRRIVELEVIRTLVEAGHVVVCCGGGGVPVVRDERGWYMGVAAVIEVGATSALLARELGATTQGL